MHRISTALEGGGHIVTGSSTLESHDGMPFAQQNTHTTQMSYCSVLVYSNLSEITWVCVSRLKCFSNCGLVRPSLNRRELRRALEPVVAEFWRPGLGTQYNLRYMYT